MKLDSQRRPNIIGPMVFHKRQHSHYWASLFLLLALVAAQPLWAEHFHLDNSQVEVCDLCCMQMPAALASEFAPIQAKPESHDSQPSLAIPQNRQPEHQNARAPPPFLSLS
ncbi:hypothetical protein [uncultured Microbulbifer sp.]|uniref:hypothetical protein n=1 Tax=uncultured Microbulbifer sp. TaxID=348147 RepID=UPI00262879D6|nr:hypothetical protein [uncultured Microbulbifer sp.]